MPWIKVSIPQSEFCPLGQSDQDARLILPPQFQFLSRNSVRWDVVDICALAEEEGSFNSSVGILSVGTMLSNRARKAKISFNSSVGILSVGTCNAERPADRWGPFQFLSRNSVRWDQRDLRALIVQICVVSIPQSEFCPLGQIRSRKHRFNHSRVSIPQSEFCPLGPGFL